LCLELDDLRLVEILGLRGLPAGYRTIARGPEFCCQIVDLLQAFRVGLAVARADLFEILALRNRGL
jgi:hypothetical protein